LQQAFGKPRQGCAILTAIHDSGSVPIEDDRAERALDRAWKVLPLVPQHPKEVLYRSSTHAHPQRSRWRMKET
jgi:hypothetical protein